MPHVAITLSLSPSASLPQAKPTAVLIAAILAPIYLFILPSFDPCPGVPFLTRLAKFDFLGSALSVGAIVCLIMGINFGGVLYDWNSGSIIALFVISGVLFIVFALQQIFTVLTTEDERVFPVHLVRRKEPVLLFIAGSSAGAAIYIAIYYIPIYFQFTRGDSAIQAAVRLLPFVFILSAMVLVNGFFMAKWGRYTPWYLTGSVIALIGAVLMCKSIHINAFLTCSQNTHGAPSQNRREHVRLSNLRLRGLDCIRRRLIRSGLVRRHPDHCNARGDVLRDNIHASWYVKSRNLLILPPELT